MALNGTTHFSEWFGINSFTAAADCQWRFMF